MVCVMCPDCESEAGERCRSLITKEPMSIVHPKRKKLLIQWKETHKSEFNLAWSKYGRDGNKARPKKKT